MRFVLAHALTGRIVGDIHPTTYRAGDPLRGSGTGSFTLSLKSKRNTDSFAAWLKQPTKVCMADDDGHWLWGGPVKNRFPSGYDKDAGTITLSCVDWAGWINQCFLRPDPDVADWSGDYLRTAVDPAQAVYDLAQLALATGGAPDMAFAPVQPIGVTRVCKYRALTTIGACMDDLAGRDDSPEWWVDTIPVDERTIIPRVLAAPVRRLRASPIRLEHVDPEPGRPGSGNLLPGWKLPEIDEPPGRVWAIGAGQPPDQKWGMEEDPDLALGAKLCWEQSTELIGSAYTRSQAYEYAAAQYDSMAAPEATASVSTLATDPAVGSYGTGDRARLILRDRWLSGPRAIDLPAVRIIDRVYSGGDGEADKVEHTLDLSDSQPLEEETGDVAT